MALCAVLALASLNLMAQSHQQSSIPQSELARQNMERVAATVGQLVAIFHRDPGLMVELKRWIAKDATDHGQLISDSDLTDEAIYDRLENDITFRSVATSLVQKYGFLRPNLNPESPLAQEQQILIRERARYVAQDEAAARAKTRQQQADFDEAQYCDPVIKDCPPVPSTSNPSIQEVPQQQSPNQPPGNAPGIQNVPTTPQPSQPPPANDVASLMRTSADDSFLNEQMQSGTSNSSGSTSGGQGFGQTGSNLTQGQRNRNNPEDLSLGSDFAGDTLISDLPPNTSTGSIGRSVDSPGVNNVYASGPAETPGPTLSSIKRAQESVSPTQRLVRKQNPYERIPSLYDMYLQAAPRPPAAERFGMQIFESSTRDLKMFPTDLPVGPDYVLGPGDGVSVDLWGGVSRRFYRIVDKRRTTQSARSRPRNGGRQIASRRPGVRSENSADAVSRCLRRRLPVANAQHPRLRRRGCRKARSPMTSVPSPPRLTLCSPQAAPRVAVPCAS